MEDLIYYSERVVSLDDLCTLSHQLGYLTQSFTLTNECLNVLYSCHNEAGLTQQGYLRWNNSNISDIDAAKLKQIAGSGFQVRSTFWMQYYWTERSFVVAYLREIMKAFGGCFEIAFSSNLFTSDTLDEFLSIVLPDE